MHQLCPTCLLRRPRGRVGSFSARHRRKCFFLLSTLPKSIAAFAVRRYGFSVVSRTLCPRALSRWRPLHILLFGSGRCSWSGRFQRLGAPQCDCWCCDSHAAPAAADQRRWRRARSVFRLFSSSSLLDGQWRAAVIGRGGRAKKAWPWTPVRSEDKAWRKVPTFATARTVSSPGRTHKSNYSNATGNSDA